MVRLLNINCWAGNQNYALLNKLCTKTQHITLYGYFFILFSLNLYCTTCVKQ